MRGILRKSIDACPICKLQSNYFVLTTQDHDSSEIFKWFRCKNCSHFFIQDPPVESHLGDFYLGVQGELMVKKQSVFIERLHWLQNSFEFNDELKFLCRGDYILDFGGGNGLLSAYFKSLGFEVRSVDFHDHAKSLLANDEFATDDLNDTRQFEKFIFRGAKAPRLVVMRHVLEHLYDPVAVVKELKRLGVERVLILVPNGGSRWRKVFGDAWYYWEPPRHLHVFTRQSGAELASQVSVLESKISYLGIDEVGVSIYRWIRLRFGDYKWARCFSRFFAPRSIFVLVYQAFGFVFGRGVLKIRLVFLKDS
jgi:hypothetical protein